MNVAVAGWLALGIVIATVLLLASVWTAGVDTSTALGLSAMVLAVAFVLTAIVAAEAEDDQ